MGNRILIVEDDQDSRLGLVIRLRSAGYEPVIAVDGATAIMIAKKEKPDLIILDLGLPGGDGFQVLERLKTLAPTSSIPVIILSARDPAANRQRGLNLGAVAFFQKPGDNAELLATIREHIEDPSAQSGGPPAIRKKILIVEDDPESRQALSLRLRTRGYEVIEAADALAALSTSLKERPDLILLDLGLPGGNGLVVLDRLKTNSVLTLVPVIILTGTAMDSRGLPEGAAGYFTKPVNHEVLFQAIEKELRVTGS